MKPAQVDSWSDIITTAALLATATAATLTTATTAT